MEQAAVRVTGLSLQGGGGALLAGVDLVCRAGERVALVGASGSGKSLTAKAVLGVLPPGLTAEGSVRIAGTEVLGVPCARRAPDRRPAAVLQDSALALHPLVTVGEQIALPLPGRLRRADTRRRVRDLLASVGLPDQIAERYPGQLSGGQRQRACLALALAAQPPLLVADEPTTALDVITQAAIVSLLKDRTGRPDGPALLFITHDLAVAAGLCTRIVVMHGGRVIENGPILDVLREPRHERTRELVGAARSAAA
ncbi:ATP-binding cassette domain-containing protein [Actinoplanes utahensis]|uniref:ABC transporter domain-containing protein n=1 Tax=Actinoplanes utahensis TaxID=1869 RepID=A0A0A6UQY1_ACTUT|nr:ATP-binding cassette domain-containing protein [Actinoplanes utahensis]KHD77816.1 hypothetical protein MB27_08455 [Actinoplanes utahensis]GIF32516.1 ABC transporter ATP-binding protein [Actinoplanes utahensis]